MLAHKVRVGVIFGGRSGEHEVSIASARSVMDAIDKDKYQVVPIGITREGHWIELGGSPGTLEALEAEGCGRVALLGDPSQRGLMRLDDAGGAIEVTRVAELDVVFPVLHGTYGEDGTVQGLLELAGIPYVGAGVLGSALGLDKAVFKDVMQAHDLPIVNHLLVLRKEWEADPHVLLDRVESSLSYPVFTKPANMGSSVGISKCHDRDGLAAGLAEAALYDRKLLVEAAVPAAREIEVSVLGNDNPIASVTGEVVPGREFYSYEAKYIDLGEAASKLVIPAPLSPEMTESVRCMAVDTYVAIDCAGMARVDFLLSGQTGELYINEVNTIPGFTAISMYPKLWEISGISFTELIDRLIDLAVERHTDKERSKTWYGTRD